jgi:ankyrin repeat protein
MAPSHLVNEYFIEAVAQSDLEFIKTIWQYKPDVNASSIYTYAARPLHIATSNGCAKIVEFLLGSGADVNAIDDIGRSALLWAVETQQADMTNQLLRYVNSLHFLKKKCS